MNVSTRRRRPAVTAAAAAGLLITLSACSSAFAAESDETAVGLSNYYSGNSWRKAMVASFESEAAGAKDAGIITKFSASDSNGSVPQQAAQIQSMIIQGYKVILIEAASPTALNGSVKKACEAGITVVAFDSVVTEPCAYKVATDYRRYGQIEAQFLADQLGGKGNLLMVRGIPGNSVDNDIYAGVQDVLAKYPDLKLVSEVYGQFTESVAQQQVAGVIPSLPKIDGVLTEGNDGGGAMQAFIQSGVPTDELPIVVMGNTGQDLQLWQKIAKENPDYRTMSISSYPSMSTMAMWVAVNLLEGKEIPRTVQAPLLTIPEENRDAWADALGYTDVANTVVNREETQKYIDATVAGNPTFVDSPLPKEK